MFKIILADITQKAYADSQLNIARALVAGYMLTQPSRSDHGKHCSKQVDGIGGFEVVTSDEVFWVFLLDDYPPLPIAELTYDHTSIRMIKNCFGWASSN